MTQEDNDSNVDEVVQNDDDTINFTGFEVYIGPFLLDLRLARKATEFGETVDLMVSVKEIPDRGDVVLWLGDSGGFHDVASYAGKTVWFHDIEDPPLESEKASEIS